MSLWLVVNPSQGTKVLSKYESRPLALSRALKRLTRNLGRSTNLVMHHPVRDNKRDGKGAHLIIVLRGVFVFGYADLLHLKRNFTPSEKKKYDQRKQCMPHVITQKNVLYVDC